VRWTLDGRRRRRCVLGAMVEMVSLLLGGDETCLYSNDFEELFLSLNFLPFLIIEMLMSSQTARFALPLQIRVYWVVLTSRTKRNKNRNCNQRRTCCSPSRSQECGKAKLSLTCMVLVCEWSGVVGLLLPGPNRASISLVHRLNNEIECNESE
jgi:hypothetical protein